MNESALKERLKVVAKEKGVLFNIVWKQLLLERFAVTLGKMKDKIQVDIGVGDKVEPVEEAFHPFQYKGKPIFAGEITLLTYPVETILAEKLETVVSKGATNSRMKDYHDIWLMLREPGLISPAAAKASIDATFRSRNTVLTVPIHLEGNELAQLETLWAQHLTRIAKFRDQLGIPGRIEDVLAEINAWLSTNGIEGVKNRMINVGVDAWGFYPVPITTIENLIQQEVTP